MLPTSARVAQEVYEPLIGIQYPMLRSRMGDTWQIGATSIREDQRIATGLRFVHWCHASPNLQAQQNPNNDPTVRVYQHLEDQLAKAGSDAEDILALTTTREGATNLRNYFSIADKKANAETAVKVAGATAKHCIVIHGVSTFLGGEGRHLDYDQECFTRANVAYFFFPRVRTPCGHGAQVIVEGREEQSDGGEKNKETQHHTKPTNTTTRGPQAMSPPSCSLSSAQGETCETKKSV